MKSLKRISTTAGDGTAETTGFSRGGDHFDPDNDVILRIEAMRGFEHKVGENLETSGVVVPLKTTPCVLAASAECAPL